MNQGVNHNIPILRDIISQPRFVSGDITTNFISEVYPQGFKGQLYTVHAQYLRSSKSEKIDRWRFAVLQTLWFLYHVSMDAHSFDIVSV